MVLKDTLKVGIVGVSGSGKSKLAHLMGYSLGLSIFEAGELMRKRHPDLDSNPGLITVDDDLFIDDQIIKSLSEPNKSFVGHGRTFGLLARHLIRSNVLDPLTYLHIAIECPPRIKAERGLAKYRIKENNPNLTVQEVMAKQKSRDERDFERLKDEANYESLYGLKRPGDLVKPSTSETTGHRIDSSLFTPLQELKQVLDILYNQGRFYSGGYSIALLRGMIKSSSQKFLLT